MSYEQLKVATQVDVRKEIQSSKYVVFDGVEKNGLRVLFVGNSITLHEVNKNIGWYNTWGMAASAKEKDYVHLCIRHIRQYDPCALFGICQVGEWERKYQDGDSTLCLFEAARNFTADVIVVKLGANCPHENFYAGRFKNCFASLMEYLNKTGHAKVIVASEFYRHPSEEILKEYAEDMGYIFVSLSDLGERPEMRALGLFEHEGVANHPGDLGMAHIAQRLCEALDVILSE